MDCPRCKTSIPDTARNCSCGWRKRGNVTDAYETSPVVDCAHANCSAPAICRIKTKTGWANVCKNHYDRHYADEAHANLDRYGLAKLPDETNAEHVGRMREFVRAGFKKMVTR